MKEIILFNFFKKKSSNKTMVDKLEDLALDSSFKKIEIMQRPKICCLDINDADTQSLKKNGLNIITGTLGTKVKVANKKQYEYYEVLPNCNIPNNLHEYDITILDLNNANDRIEYSIVSHQRTEHTGSNLIALASQYPETLFDSRPWGSNILSNTLRHLNSKEHLVISFSTVEYDVNYQIINKTHRGVDFGDSYKYNIYDFHDMPLAKSKIGNELVVSTKSKKLKDFLQKYITEMSYSQTFYHPTDYNNIERENYEPILKSINGDIVSFIKVEDNITFICFPQVKDKSKFLNEFLLDIAPSLFPNLFPYSIVNEWKNEESYWLPNHKKLQEEQVQLISEYEDKLKMKKNEIVSNLKKFSFLHKLLTETGDELVNNIIQFFEWLEFENIVNMDYIQEGKVLEEDIQIEIDKGLLVIECKGIGGTSKDSECSQVSKIKYRRAEERGTFDVFALYIVNHQRHKAPLLRENPPFTKEQEEDAKRDKRGLVTTWQLYNLYFDIKLGILNKEKAREILLDYGLINFKKGLISVDITKEVFVNNTVCIVNITNIELKVGDILFIEKNKKYYKVTILDIQKDGKSIEIGNNGEFGLKLDSPIKKNSKIWKNSNKQ